MFSVTCRISDDDTVRPLIPGRLTGLDTPVVLLSGTARLTAPDDAEKTGVRLPPELVAFNTRLLPIHIAAGVGTETKGDGITFITTVDVAGVQIPGGSFVVSVKVTEPLVILGVYVEVSEVAFEKLPLGAVHVAVLALPPIVPFSVTDPPAHTVCGEPAFAVVPLLTVTTIVLETAGHEPAGSLVVSVSVTEPLAMVGVYVDVSELTFENEPLGALHVAEVALPPIVPARSIAPEEQIPLSGPASTIAAGLTVITTVEVTGGHGPAGSFVVSVSVTVPLVILGVYVEFNALGFEKVPLGALHVPDVAAPPTAPFNVADPPAHTVCGLPAFAVATGFRTTFVEAVTGQPYASLETRVYVPAFAAVEFGITGFC